MVVYVVKVMRLECRKLCQLLSFIFCLFVCVKALKKVQEAFNMTVLSIC